MLELLYYLTRCAIYGNEPSDYMEKFGNVKVDWDTLFKVATDNNLISVIYSVILKINSEHTVLTDEQMQWIMDGAKGTLLHELQKYYMIRRLVKTSEQKGIKFVFFKGIILADLYPQYVERVSSDSDIYVDAKDLSLAEDILREYGYVLDPQESKDNVKVYYHDNSKHMVELHTKLWEDYKGPRIDILESFCLTDGIITQKACGMDVYTLGYENHLIYQLFHIIKHFSLEGIGARYLVDIALFVNNYIENINVESFWDKISKLGYTKFVNVFFSICIKYLDMDKAIMSGHQILSDKRIKSLMDDLLKVGCATDKEARWQIMGAMEAYFTGEEKVSKTSLGKKLQMAFPSVKAMPKVYIYAKRHPILLPFAWIHRDIKFLFKKMAHKDDFYGVGEKMDVAEKRLSLLDELGLAINDK